MPRIAARDGTELYVKDWGEGRPVVLIHGWPLSADSWDDHARLLAENGFRAIAYDRRASAAPTSLGRATTTTRWPTTSPR